MMKRAAIALMASSLLFGCGGKADPPKNGEPQAEKLPAKSGAKTTVLASGVLSPERVSR